MILPFLNRDADGRRQESRVRNQSLPFNPVSVDARILLHAHIEHSGNLPNLVMNGFEAPIYVTKAMAHLVNIMLIDSGHIQESDAEYVNKKRLKRGEEPIYTMEATAHMMQYFAPVGEELGIGREAEPDGDDNQ